MSGQKVFILCIHIVCLMSIESVSSAILCNDSKIDAIAYTQDNGMYFISIGRYYWWVKNNKFPIKESDALELPSPFTKATAAVYIDADAGCAVQTRSGMKAKEKEIWITDYIDGEVKMMAYDTKYGKWTKGPISYEQENCIAKAQIDFTSGKPIDAMFTRNYLEVYLVQGTKYAMVDCKFLCSDPDSGQFGMDSKASSTSDFGTQDPINAMFRLENKADSSLLMFQEKKYYEVTVKSKNGKLVFNKRGPGKDIIKDFLKLKDLPDECGGEATPPLPSPSEEPEPENSESPDVPEAEPSAGVEPQNSNVPPEDSDMMLWIIVAIVAIALIVIVTLLAFFVMKKKPAQDQEAGMDARPGSKVASHKSGSRVGSKVGSAAGSNAGTSPANRSLSAKSTRSSMGKSRAPAIGVKSSAPKK